MLLVGGTFRALFGLEVGHLVALTVALPSLLDGVRWTRRWAERRGAGEVDRPEAF